MYMCLCVFLAALDDVCELEAALRPGLEEIENYQKLLELQKDLMVLSIWPWLDVSSSDWAASANSLGKAFNSACSSW